jgi:hypothetical protein
LAGIKQQMRSDNDARENTKRREDEERKERQKVENKKLVKDGVKNIRKKGTGKGPAKAANPRTKSKKKAASSENETTDDEEDETEVWEIINHKVCDGEPRLEMDTCDETDPQRIEWYDTGPLIKDGLGEKVKAYIERHCNEGPWLKVVEEIDESGVVEKMDESGVVEKTNGSGTVVEKKRKEVPLPETRLVEKTNSPCRHNTYEEELTYSQEQNGAYCKKGFYLCGLKCGGCGVNFVASGKEDGQCRPGGSNPVYCCVNMKGRSSTRNKENDTCQHVICNTCWKKGVTEGSNAEEGRKRRRRA